MKAEYVSVHGGHSGQFCNHATDMLEDIIHTYIDKGFKWVGITEHAPAPSSLLMYEDEREMGLTAEFLFSRFGGYIREARRLQDSFKRQIEVFVGIEIETYSGYKEFVPYLIKAFNPDYIVGSVHFVNDINFDYSPERYERAAESVGGLDALYEAYFDLQYEMIANLQPAVVGHFDLIRLFDDMYQKRMRKPSIASRIRRNLELVKKFDLILDFNLRALAKGASEPYISEQILKQAKQLEIKVVPGDDSHGISSVGNYIEEGLSILENNGFRLQWSKPRLRG